ncbi:hypothetical protein, partial [Asanoa iriomotensis]|uniref:hypothetical protein n=1 Tax=Asanoa iriomotensis TaxID=234613 RepID=UPI001942C089
ITHERLDPAGRPHPITRERLDLAGRPHSITNRTSRTATGFRHARPPATRCARPGSRDHDGAPDDIEAPATAPKVSRSSAGGDN